MFTIENLPSYRISYVRQTGPYGMTNVYAMEKLKDWARNRGLLNGESIIFGIPQDNPETTLPEDCRYDACIVLTETYAVQDDDIDQGNMAGGKYAVYRTDHTAEGVRRAWTEIFPELLRHGHQLDETRPIVERYAAKLVSNHECEICVPIR